MKNKHGQRPQPSTKQTWCSYKLKRIHICGVHLGLLPQTSSSALRLWVILVFSISISVCSGEALASGWPWFQSSSLPFCYAYMVNSLEICAQILDCIGFVPAYSIPGAYVHKLCILLLFNRGVVCAYMYNSHRICARVALVFRLIRKSLVKDLLGRWKTYWGVWFAEKYVDDPRRSLFGM